MVKPGDYVGVIGPSGSGKSTLLNILGLLDVPDFGEHRFDGLVTNELPDGLRAALRATQIGFVFQQFHLLPRRTAADNVELGLVYSRRRQQADRRNRVESALTRVGLAHRGAALAATLSGGEAQRLAIARAIVREPQLILADEPTGNLDTKTSESVLEVIEELRATLGLAVVMVTHNPTIVQRCSRVIRVVDGVVGE